MNPLLKVNVKIAGIPIPANLYSGIEEYKPEFHRICSQCNERIILKNFCPKHGEIPFQKLRKVYQIGENELVLENGDIQKEKSDKEVKIIQFSDLSDIDPIYFQKFYYLLPYTEKDKVDNEGYSLLYAFLKKVKKVAVASLMVRSKEYLVALRPFDGVLVLNCLWYQNEIKEVIKPKIIESNKEALNLFAQLVVKMSKKFDIQDFENPNEKRIKEQIERKIRGEKVKIEKVPEKSESLLEQLKNALK